MIVTDRMHITDFISNADKEVFDTITTHIDNEKKKHAIKPLKVQSEPEDIANGAPETYTVPIAFDQSNFFA